MVIDSEGIMKKIIFVIITISLILISLTNCTGNIYHWNFEQDVSEIKELKVVNAKDEFDYEVIKELDICLIEELCQDIQSLKMTKYGSNLRHPYGECFLIVYHNGDYDIISEIEPKHIKNTDDKLIAYNSWLRCDLEEFNALIKKYL